MKYYLAPLEGITTHVYRKLHHEFFAPMDKYFTPFLVPHTKRGLTNREKAEIDPKNNKGMYLVPQILTKDPKGFLSTVEKLEEYGYKEVNLNLGCPSKTVTGKGRGSGFLKDLEGLARFLDEIYRNSRSEISIKTRLGFEREEEFPALLNIYKQYPIKELIVHPRTTADYYVGEIHFSMYEEASIQMKSPVCYNGDIRTTSDAAYICEKYGNTDGIMIGRGIIADPMLLNRIKKKEVSSNATINFLLALCDAYKELIGNEKQTLYKMKEIASYLSWNHMEKKKEFKRMMKINRLDDFKKGIKEVI